MTAVEFISEQIKWRTNMVDIILEAKQMEKQQIIDAYASGVLNECSGANIRSEQYYNEKYGIQGEAKE